MQFLMSGFRGKADVPQRASPVGRADFQVGRQARTPHIRGVTNMQVTDLQVTISSSRGRIRDRNYGHSRELFRGSAKQCPELSHTHPVASHHQLDDGVGHEIVNGGFAMKPGRCIGQGVLLGITSKAGGTVRMCGLKV